MSKFAPLLCACVILCGCAASPHNGRAQLTVPAPVSAVYSEFNLRVMLVTTADTPNRCTRPECLAADGLIQRVARIGPELAEAAYRSYPDLRSRIESFEFVVADKSEPGTASTSQGRIIILRPVESLAQTDAAAAFVLGREMGHVVAQHHDENTATSLIVSGLVQLLAPVANVARVFSSFFLPGAATASASASAAASASVTATSVVGSRVLVASYKPRQRDEADAIAMNLLERLGYDVPAITEGFSSVDLRSEVNDWTADLRASVERLSAPAQPAGNGNPRPVPLARVR